MKKILSTIFILFLILNAYAQYRPKILLLPSKIFCMERKYITVNSENGNVKNEPNYKQAFEQDPGLVKVVSRINGLFTDRGIPTIDAQGIIKNIEQNPVSENTDKYSASSLGYSKFSEYSLIEKSGADILVYVGYSEINNANERSLFYELYAIDNNTSKVIAKINENLKVLRSELISTALENAIVQKFDEFSKQFQNYFDDMIENGREINIKLSCSRDFDKNFQTETNDGVGSMLSEVITDWFNKNSVKGKFKIGSSTKDNMRFEQVRIPLKDETGRSIDANDFLRRLRKFLKATPYNIDSKIIKFPSGGMCFILGEK